jgi:putative Holliday junction resolvase
MTRILGLDVGDRRIGVALSDPLGLTAQPLTVIERRDAARDVDALSALVAQHQVSCIVVGLPLTLRGEQGIQADKVESFVQRLRSRVRLPVELIDERLTTVQGERALAEGGASRRQRKAAIDQVAAQLILQQFLDTRRGAETPEEEG